MLVVKTEPCTTSQHGGAFLVAGLHHHSGALVGAELQLPYRQSPTEAILPAAAKEIKPAQDNNDAVLNCHH